jgi:hypothetical protein
MNTAAHTAGHGAEPPLGRTLNVIRVRPGLGVGVLNERCFVQVREVPYEHEDLNLFQAYFDAHPQQLLVGLAVLKKLDSTLLPDPMIELAHRQLVWRFLSQMGTGLATVVLGNDDDARANRDRVRTLFAGHTRTFVSAAPQAAAEWVSRRSQELGGGNATTQLLRAVSELAHQANVSLKW